MRLVKSQRGIGLLELMLSLAIIAILLVMATRYFASARQGQQVAGAISMIQAVAAASQNYFIAHNNTFSNMGLSSLKSGNYLPTNSSVNGPWGGQIQVQGGSDSAHPTAVKITIPNVPGAACNELMGALKSQAIAFPGTSCSAGSAGDFVVEI